MNLKKVVLVSLCGIGGMCAASQVFAADNDNSNTGFYMSGGAGASYTKNTSNNVIYPSDLNIPGDHVSFPGQHGITYAGSLAAGYDLYSQYQVPVRVELNYTARSNLKKTSNATFSIGGDTASQWLTGKTGLQTLMVNAYYDFHNSTPFTPYVLVGAGLAHISYSNERGDAGIPAGDPGNDNVSGNANNFAYSVGAGVSYQIMDNLSTDLTVNYINAGKVTTGNTGNSDDTATQGVTSTKVSAIDTMVNVRYTF